MELLKKNKSNVVKYTLDISVLILCFGSLLYCLKGSFNFDDAVGYYYKGIQLCDGMDLWDYILFYEKKWIELGRFLPLVIPYKFLVFYIFREYACYECYIIILTCISVLLLGKLLSFFFPEELARVAEICAIICFQVFSVYHNALIGYAGLYQVLAIILLAETIFYYKYCTTQKKWCFVLVIIFETVAVLFYEIAFLNVLFLGVVYCAAGNKLRRKWKEALLVISPSIIVFIITMSLRFATNVNYSGITINLDLIQCFLTFSKQFIISFPLMHYSILDYRSILQSNEGIYPILLSFYSFFLSFISIGLLIRRSYRDYKRVIVCCALFFGFAVLCSGFTALSSKYQLELYYGIAYMNVYYQWLCIGVVLSGVICGLLSAINHCKWLIGVALSLFIGVCSFLNYQVEIFNINQVNNWVGYPKQILSESIEEGVLMGVNDEDYIVTVNAAPYENKYFYAEYTGKVTNVVTITQFWDATDSLPKEANMFMIYYTGSEDEGKVIVARISRIDKSKQMIYTDNVRTYIKGENTEEAFDMGYSIEKVCENGILLNYIGDECLIDDILMI